MAEEQQKLPQKKNISSAQISLENFNIASPPSPHANFPQGGEKHKAQIQENCGGSAGPVYES